MGEKAKGGIPLFDDRALSHYGFQPFYQFRLLIPN